MKVLYIFLALFAWTACSHSHTSEEDKKLLAEAKKTHEEAYKIHDEIMPKMDKIAEQKKSLEEYLSTEKENLKESEVAQLQSKIEALEKVQEDMKTWMDNAVGVPGEDDHEHHDHEGHDHHDHAKAPEVTAKEMLEIQKEMKANIEKLKADMKAATRFVMIKGERKFESDIFTE